MVFVPILYFRAPVRLYQPFSHRAPKIPSNTLKRLFYAALRAIEAGETQRMGTATAKHSTSHSRVSSYSGTVRTWLDTAKRLLYAVLHVLEAGETPCMGTATAKRSTAHSRVSSYSGTVGVVCQSEAEV